MRRKSWALIGIWRVGEGRIRCACAEFDADGLAGILRERSACISAGALHR